MDEDHLAQLAYLHYYDRLQFIVCFDDLTSQSTDCDNSNNKSLFVPLLVDDW